MRKTKPNITAIRKLIEALNYEELVVYVDLNLGTLRFVPNVGHCVICEKPLRPNDTLFPMYGKFVCPRCLFLIQTLGPEKTGSDDSAKPRDTN